MIENIRLSLKGIWSHKMRSFLTMLGIIIGIAAIIAIVSTIKGTNEQIKNNLIGSGTNTVTVQLYRDNYPAEFAYEPAPEGIPIFTDDIHDRIIGFSEIESVTLVNKREYADSVYYGNTNLSSSILGVDQYYFDTAGYQIIKGRGFSESDLKTSKAFCIVDESISASFGGAEPVGQVLDIMGTPFVVIGVVSQKSTFEPVINSIEEYYTYMQNSNGAIFIPQQMWPVIYQYDEPQAVIVRAKSTDDMTQAGKKTQELLNKMLPNTDTYKYQSNDLSDEAAQIQQLSNSTNTMLVGIASISLLVGGIGVMNIMLVSVTERTREIGLKKALGARKRRILGQFLTEAAMLSLIGGIIGIGLGIGLSRLISILAGVPVAISMPAIVVAVVFSMFVGIVFGLVPSIKASNLNPIEALGYE
ncbi:MAG: ABC transporter permease [Clostridiales bacterium]|nr:ABC transporter permease [Clostridiales bacterium]